MSKLKLDVINTCNYGLCLFSPSELINFLKKNKKRNKRILDLFSNDHDIYIDSLKNGVWIPISNIDSDDYQLEILSGSKNDYIFVYKHFNLKIGINGLWICDIGKLLKFDKSYFLNKDYLSYYTYDKQKIINGVRFEIPEGEYRVNIYGSLIHGKPCFSFELIRKTLFKEINDPRKYDFRFL